MFTLTIKDSGRLIRFERSEEVLEFLEGCEVGQEVLVQGLGRFVVLRPTDMAYPFQFYTWGNRAEARELYLGDIQEMLEVMEGEPIMERVQEEPPVDPSEESWDVVEYQAKRMWQRPTGGPRKSYVGAFGVVYWARAYPLGTRLTFTVQVDIKLPSKRT